ncbi:MAG TPA: hypothetical protein VK631_08485 [Solirubrobacteraceae bacterium]|nr:hypothetical protein [Solirubrobacteraceae bacterium]
MLAASEIRACIAALRPPAQAFDRAVRNGHASLDDECGWLMSDALVPAPPANPDQLTLEQA